MQPPVGWWSCGWSESSPEEGARPNGVRARRDLVAQDHFRMRIEGGEVNRGIIGVIIGVLVIIILVIVILQLT